MKRIFLNLLSRLSFVNKYFSGMITIFMLHREYPFEANKLLSNENMKVSPEFLEGVIIELRSKEYEFISLDDVYEILIKGKKVNKKIVFTLDDGYVDNYEIAYPIFRKYKVPFTIYITTSFPENTAILWWYILEDIILENDAVELPDGKIFFGKTKKEKEEVFLQIRQIVLSLKKSEFEKFLEELFSKYIPNWRDKNEELCKKLCMNWRQIIELSKDGLCTIGGHTKNHYSLNNLKEKEVVSEIVEANQLIESKIDKKVEHFAYPFGDKNTTTQREFEIVKKLGLKTAVTTRYGNVYKEHKNHLNKLPRIMLVENFDLKDIGKIRRKRIVTA